MAHKFYVFYFFMVFVAAVTKLLEHKEAQLNKSDVVCWHASV